MIHASFRLVICAEKERQKRDFSCICDILFKKEGVGEARVLYGCLILVSLKCCITKKF